MKKILVAFCLCYISTLVFAQSDDIEKLHDNAKTFMRQGDYANASLILSRALTQSPGNIEIAKNKTKKRSKRKNPSLKIIMQMTRLTKLEVPYTRLLDRIRTLRNYTKPL
jgi:hypothetical protein